MPVKSPDPKAVVLLFHWQATWVGLVVLGASLAALMWYAGAVRRLGRVRSGGEGSHAKKWPAYTSASFVVGVLIVAYVFDGGIVYYQQDNFTTHVVQLLLLFYVAPPLLAAGAPLRLALLTSRGRTERALLHALHSRLAKVLSHPLVGFVAAVATLYVYLLTPVYAASERHPLLLAYAQVQILVVSSLLWWAVVGRDALPRVLGFGWRFALVFGSIPFVGFLGVGIAAATSPLYPAGNTLVDTHQGGNVFWGLGVLFVVAMATYLFVEWAREEQRRAEQRDRQLDAALAVARSIALPAEEGGSAGEGGPSGGDAPRSRLAPG